MTQATIPFDEQEVFSEKAQIPELVSIESDKEVHGFAFNGLILKASGSLVIGGKNVAPEVLMKPNCICAISQSNKRYLASYKIHTDYVEPNQLLFRALGFSEQESKHLVYVKGMDMLPIYFMVTGYGTNHAMKQPQVTCHLKNGTPISYEEADMIMADWLYDSGYESEYSESFKEYESIEKARMEANVSRRADDYANRFCEEDEWSKLEAACMFDIATSYISSIASNCQAIYSLLCKKYGPAGIILANVKLEFGLDDMAEPTLCGEVATPDTALLVSGDLYDLYGTLDNMAEEPVMKFFDMVGYTGETDQKMPELPMEVLDELADTYIYLAEALCDDFAFELNM
ncbi:MAG: hypothetical protein IKL55_00175 [Clostridia bacterium]|nr:hypothetical protein [Clostridia bacterium]